MKHCWIFFSFEIGLILPRAASNSLCSQHPTWPWTSDSCNPKYWDYQCVPPCSTLDWWALKPRVSYILGKHSTSCATSTILYIFSFYFQFLLYPGVLEQGRTEPSAYLKACVMYVVMLWSLWFCSLWASDLSGICSVRLMRDPCHSIADPCCTEQKSHQVAFKHHPSISVQAANVWRLVC